MNADRNDKKLDELISKTIGRDKPQFDFDKWQINRRKEIETFKSQTTEQKKRPVRIFKIGKTIMKSRVSKIAAAAVIIIVATMTLRNGSVDMTSPAFGVEDIIAAMQQAEWMHSTARVVDNTNFDPNRIKKKLEGLEYWQSINPNRTVYIEPGGMISFRDENLGKIWKYDPEINTITLTYQAITDQELPKDLPDVYLTTVSALVKRGAKVEYCTGTYNDESVQIIMVDEETEDGRHNKMEILANTETQLAKKVTIYQEAANGVSVTISLTIDYPKMGPTDIYQAGAPRDAKLVVVDARDKPQLVEALEPYNKARENLVSDYILVTTYERGSSVHTIYVTYNQGRKQRSEYHPIWGSVVSNDDKIAYKKALGDSFESLLRWSQDYGHSKGKNFGIHIYDGEYYYRAEKSPSDKWTVHERRLWPAHNPPTPLEDLSGWGWPGIPPKYCVKQIENDYSRENNLIAFEVTTGSDIRNGKIFVTAQKTINYLDPSRDYMCVRREMFYHPLSGGLGDTKIKDVDFDPNEIPDEPSFVRFVSEFGQTENGQWYPKKIEKHSKSLDRNGNEKPLSLSSINTLYLKTNPVFPEGIFDPNNLPREDG